jgi:hypothetical protein
MIPVLIRLDAWEWIWVSCGRSTGRPGFGDSGVIPKSSSWLNTGYE